MDLKEDLEQKNEVLEQKKEDLEQRPMPLYDNDFGFIITRHVNSEKTNNPTSNKKESSADKNASKKQQRSSSSSTTTRGSSYSTSSNSRNLEKIIKVAEDYNLINSLNLQYSFYKIHYN